MLRRNTLQKEYVLHAVKELHSHVTADEIYAYVIKSHPSIGKGTVYRNLNILCEEGLVKHIGISDGPDIYDFSLHEHYHVKCVACKKVFDVDMDAFADMHERIHNDHGFEFLSYDILFKGICPDCRDKGESDLQTSSIRF